MSNLVSSRRGFLTSAGAALICAPAIVRAGSLMPVKVWKPVPLPPGSYAFTIDDVRIGRMNENDTVQLLIRLPDGRTTSFRMQLNRIAPHAPDL